jgi:hypothetical protein
VSTVIDEPRTTMGTVRLGNRVARVRGAAFRWFMAGKMAAYRSEFMRAARQKKQDGEGWGVGSAVANARYYHHEYMREVARALELS